MPKGIPKDTSTKRKLMHQLKIARGHLDAVIAMIESGEYCIDIIHQSLAVQSALRTINQAILKDHLETCVAEAVKKGDTKAVIAEVMKVVEKS